VGKTFTCDEEEIECFDRVAAFLCLLNKRSAFFGAQVLVPMVVITAIMVLMIMRVSMVMSMIVRVVMSATVPMRVFMFVLMLVFVLMIVIVIVMMVMGTAIAV
jgi:hypothetical protein